jgi:hypothetical protein
MMNPVTSRACSRI